MFTDILAGRRRFAAALVLLLMPAACVEAPTPFQPASGPDGNGYTVTQLESDRFRVAFSGNIATSHDAVDNDLLYLAAQVTLKHGADWFALSRNGADKDTVYPTFVQPPTIYTGWGAPPLGGVAVTDFNDPQSSWNEQATILLHRGAKPAGDPEAYDARDLVAHLTPLIARGTAAGPY
jgi:hypothetical protein